MPEGTTVSTLFGRIAERYDTANHLLSFGIDYRWRRVLCRMVREHRPADVLDLATGSGDVLFKLRDTLGPEVSLTGLDFCEPMLAQARRKKREHASYTDLKFAYGDCMALPLEYASADAVTVAFGVRNFEDRARGLREILRVLRPGGALFVLEFSQPAAWFRPFYYLYLKYILPLVAALATRNKSAYDYLAGSIEQFPAKATLSRQLREAGFATVDATGLTFSIVAIHRAVKAETS